MTTMTNDLDRRLMPIGSRVRRTARVRRVTAEGIRAGREKATAALLRAARDRAIPVHMPSGLRSARTLRDRVREWALNTAASLVARKIDRDTRNAAVNRLESMKIGGRDFERGVWFFINVLKGNIAI